MLPPDHCASVRAGPTKSFYPPSAPRSLSLSVPTKRHNVTFLPAAASTVTCRWSGGGVVAEELQNNRHRLTMKRLPSWKMFTQNVVLPLARNIKACPLCGSKPRIYLSMWNGAVFNFTLSDQSRPRGLTLTQFSSQLRHEAKTYQCVFLTIFIPNFRAEKKSRQSRSGC